MKKNCFKYKELIKKKGGSKADEASTSEKQSDQADVAKEPVEELCDVLSVNPNKGKGRYSDA